MTPIPHITRVDVRETGLDERHGNALMAYRRLLVGETMEVLDGQDPIDLYKPLQAIAPGDFSWLYLKRGPDVWCVSVRKLGRIYSAGECCGACGGGSGGPAKQSTTPNQTRSNS